MQAIKVKFLPATNTKPARLKASCEAGSITVSYDYGLNYPNNAAKVALLLVAKLQWKPVQLHSGVYKGDYYFVIDDNKLVDTSNLPEILKDQV